MILKIKKFLLYNILIKYVSLCADHSETDDISREEAKFCSFTEVKSSAVIYSINDQKININSFLIEHRENFFLGNIKAENRETPDKPLFIGFYGDLSESINYRDYGYKSSDIPVKHSYLNTILSFFTRISFYCKPKSAADDINKNFTDNIKADAWLNSICSEDKKTIGSLTQMQRSRSIRYDFKKCFHQENIFFRDTKSIGYRLLVKVLNDFHSPGTQYVYGIERIAAILLLYLNEDNTTSLLLHIYRSNSFNKLFKSNDKVISKKTKEIQTEILRKNLSRIYENFKRNKIDITQSNILEFCFKVFMNLKETRMAVLMVDILIKHGFISWFYIMPAIYSMYEDELLQINTELELANFFIQYDFVNLLENPEKIREVYKKLKELIIQNKEDILKYIDEISSID